MGRRLRNEKREERDLNLWVMGRALLALALFSGALVASPVASAQGLGTVAISPTSGPPGSLALVTGSFPGFGTYDSVVIWWADVHVGRRLGATPLRSDGTFATAVRIPPEASMGTHQVIADVNYGYDQATTTFDVKAPDRSAAYIYDDDFSTAEDYKELLHANGLSTTLVQVGDVAEYDFSGFDLILAGPDSGYLGQWGSTAAVDRVLSSGKPVLGLGEGAYALFGELQLGIGYPHGVHGSEDQLYVLDPAHPVYNEPYDIYVPPNNILTLHSTPSSSVMVHIPAPPDDVMLLGQELGAPTNYLFAQQANRYLFWGYDGGPASMTLDGRDLFINAAYYLMWASDVDTLILTDYERMMNLGYSFADVSALRNDINDLRGQPETKSNMTAIHRDLSEDAPRDVPTDCAGWDGNEGDVTATNTCVEAIDDYIEHLKQSSFANLYYVIIVGTSEIIPMRAREQDHVITHEEDDWGASLPGAGSYIHGLYSSPGASGWGHYLTDSVYGDLSYVTDGWGADHELVPELAVGRLVETPAQISDLIDTYLTGDAYFSRADRVSIASDDYVDGGTLAADYMDPGTDDALVQGSFDSNDIPPKLNAVNDLVYFGGHGNYNVISTDAESFWAGNHASHGDTNDLADMPDAVVVTSGCHNGVSFGNQLYHAPDAGTTYSEFPEEFASKKAGVYVGATGYTIITRTGAGTDVAEVRHNEKLSTYVIMHLFQDGNISAGEAFRRAINSYLADVGAIGTMERRVIAITNLYGIPNYRDTFVSLPWPQPVEYWRELVWLDPPPYKDPAPFRFRVELRLRKWEIRVPGPGPEWYLEIPGATYGGNAAEPLLPVFKAGVVLPPGSAFAKVEWDMDSSESISMTLASPMYVPIATEDPLEEGTFVHAAPEVEGLYSVQPWVPYSTSTAGGAGTFAGLSMVPLQHDPQTLATTLWTKMVFTMTFQAGASSDGDGDGLPTYWEGSYSLDPNDSSGDQGASGDPDNDGLDNDGEFPAGTDPQDPDTDGDGWGDGTEVSRGTSPLNPGSHPVPLYSYLPLMLRNR